MATMVLQSRFSRKVIAFILDVLFVCVRWFVRFVLSVYWGKGEIVPRIQNPLLLKSATTLAKEIRERQLKSEDVVHAYVQRIQEVEPYINATVECVFEDAVQKAKEVDKLIESGKYTQEELAEDRPLLGVPVSIKNVISVKGLLTSVGSLFFKDLRAAEDSSCVSLMKNAGAIVIATTNVPECCLQLETNNLLQGRTRNPYNTSRTSGASSGGEAALIASGGSVLGFGNDLVGSIRFPCHLTGLFGHKPTNGLVSNDGVFPVPNSKIDSFLCSGPMCRYAEDLTTSMNVLTAQRRPRIKFGESVNFSKLKICYMLELRDHLVSPLDKEIAASITKAASYFRTRYGTSAKEVKIHSLKNTNAFGLHMLRSSIDDIMRLLTGGKMKYINEKLDLLKYFFGKSTFSLGPLLVLNIGKYPLYNKDDVPYYHDMQKKMAEEFEELLNEDTVFFFPTFPITAPYHEEMITRSPSIMYTGVFNFIGLPATQCPLGFDKDGLPYGMQIIGKVNNDPLTIACAVELEKAFGGWIQPGNA